VHPRSGSPNLSNSISDSNIFNCNKRIWGSESGIDELRICDIAKEIGVVCQECEESILQQFADMEERDRKLMGKVSQEEDIG